MYAQLYEPSSPWLSRSFNVRARSGNSPVRSRTPPPTLSHPRSQTPKAHPYPYRQAAPTASGATTAATATPRSRVGGAGGAGGGRGARSKSAGRGGQPARGVGGGGQGRGLQLERQLSVREKELNAWWEQVGRLGLDTGCCRDQSLTENSALQVTRRSDAMSPKSQR
jgi:hypothetical protein